MTSCDEWNEQDRSSMAMALDLARKGLGNVEPNPAVGAVLTRNDKIIGQGYHHFFGGPHAEVDAIRDAQARGESTRDATLYVTLEPCCHFGKTPPCTQAVIAAGVKRVVVAAMDPSDKVAGKGIAALQSAGIEVQAGLMADQAEALNAWFFKFHRHHQPWVICKWAQTLDGKLAARTGHSKWITGPEARLEAHRLRQTCQAIVVGIGTALADDPELTVRLENRNSNYSQIMARVPDRVVMDAGLRVEISSKLVQSAKVTPTWVFTSNKADKTKIEMLENLGVHVVVLTTLDSGQLNLAEFLSFAADRGWARVMVEGGAKLLSSFLTAHLADELVVFQSPSLAMDEQARQLGGQANFKADDFLRNFKFQRISQVGNDAMFRLVLK
jgi:diaminohydroxyphosphoribosylaminopyrimidine deaminase/5-amino-6-(5-phosphoribosylamino)uracil reductase